MLNRRGKDTRGPHRPGAGGRGGGESRAGREGGYSALWAMRNSEYLESDRLMCSVVQSRRKT